jgi:hypothetical protein
VRAKAPQPNNTNIGYGVHVDQPVQPREHIRLRVDDDGNTQIVRENVIEPGIGIHEQIHRDARI